MNQEKKDYKDTLNLPKTSFSMKAGLVNKEPNIQKDWEQLDVYNKILEKRKDSDKFIMHDGPPYANGDIHIGHALNKILKDIIIKYKTMQGYNVPYIPGWDCHGLPIEHQVTKKIKDADKKSKLEIRNLCREYADKYVNIQKEQFQRLGIFGEWDNPYLTMNYEYEAKTLEVFGALVEKKYVEKRLKPIYWCSSCRTALAEAEVEHDDHNSPSVYVKFKVCDDIKGLIPGIGEENVSMLIWTTTPWTLPANMAIAVGENFEYAAVRVKPPLAPPCQGGNSEFGSKSEIIVMAEKLVSSVMEKLDIIDYEILGKITGNKLEGIKYEHPFMQRVSPVILADFVTIEDGVGCVHIAPGHGEDDYKVGRKYDLEVFTPVNAYGKFTADVPLFEGQKVFDANKDIIAKLEELGVLLGKSVINHSYPHCWRCKKPIIFRATEQWFINVDKHNLRDNVLDFIKDIKWIPAWGETRITEMVKGRPDWCISRQRSWGVPIPAVTCSVCDKTILDKGIIDNLVSFVEKEGCDVWFAKELNEILPVGFKCECGNEDRGKFEKEYDILDVWFDSGVSHTAVMEQRENLSYPADLYLEGSDQHRGWFQSSIFTAVAAHDKPCFKSVLTHGFVVDGAGKKMSKSMGNVVNPLKIIKKSGADIVRLWVSSADYTEDIRTSDDIFSQRVDAYRKIRNTIRFLLGNIHDFNIEKDKVLYEDMLDIDKYVMSRLQAFIKKITDSYENYQFHKVYSEIYHYCIVEMSSFYLDILKDRLYTFGTKSLARRSAQTVLSEILLVLVKVMAPVLSFTAEEIWTHFLEKNNTEESVHFSAWPIVDKAFVDNELEKKWSMIIEVRDEVLKHIEELRSKKIIGSSLEVMVSIKVEDERYEQLLEYKEELAMIFIASKVNLEKGKQLTVTVEKIDFDKCIRCWNYREDVGKNSDFPDICERCVGVLNELI